MSTKALKIVGTITGVVLAILSWIPLGMWMDSYQKRTGYDAGNAGVLGCFAIIVLPVAGFLVGAAIGSFVNKKTR